MSQRQQLERIMEIDRRIRNREYPNADRMAEFSRSAGVSFLMTVIS